MFKIELLLWGLLVAWTASAFGATLKTQEHILHQRQLRSSVTGEAEEHITEEKDGAKNPEKHRSTTESSMKPPLTMVPSSAPSSVTSLPLHGVEIVDGTPIDFVPSVEGDMLMSGRAFHKVYSALDSIAQFMPVKLSMLDFQNVSNVAEGESNKNNSIIATEFLNGTKSPAGNASEIPLSSREALDTEGVLIGLQVGSEGNLNSNDTSAQNGTHKEVAVVNGLDDEARAIVDVSKLSTSGVSYIIHPENLPAPTYKPLENLPPPSHPVAKWRPDIFMKVCCSESEPEKTANDTEDLPSSLDVKTGYSQVGTTSPSDEEREVKGDVEILDTAEEENKESGGSDDDDVIIKGKPLSLPLIAHASNLTLSEFFNVTDINLNNETSNPEVSSNHTPRYEESGSAYQDVANFLKDIANSEGFKNAFLGDLIKNFGDLDQNAMKLIYSLLIRPLEGASKSSVKSDRKGAAPVSNTGQNRLPVKEDFVTLGKDRLPLRDEPANGYNPFGLFPPKSPPRTSGRPQQIRPSSLVRQVAPVTTDKDWHPVRTHTRLPSDGRRGDEDIDVITAPPFQTFEVVLGSSLNHDKSKPVPDNLPGNRWGAPPPPSPSQNSHGLPFDKLKLGLEMPPPEALDALPPGSVLIPPSQILNKPNLPHIFTNEDGTPSLEIPLSELHAGLQSQRLRPPSKPQIHDIPPRLPSFLSSLFPLSRPKPPQKAPNPGPMLQRPFVPSGPPGNKRPGYPPRQGPTGPPPIVTKMTPPPHIDHYTQELPSPPVNGFHDPSMFTLHSGEEPGSYDNHAAPEGHDEFEPSDHVQEKVFALTPPAPTLTPTTDPKPVGGMYMNYEPSPDEYLTQSSTAQPHMSDFEVKQASGEQPADYSADGDYETEKHTFRHEEENTSHESDDSYYKDVPVEYIIDYYDYKDYYEDQLRGEGNPSDETVGSVFESDKQYEDGKTHDRIEENIKEGFDVAAKVSPPLTKFDPVSFEDLLMGHHSSATDSATLTEQEKNDLQMLLQNHRMANAIAEANGTVFDMFPGINFENVSLSPTGSENILLSTSSSGIEDLGEDNHNHIVVPIGPQGEISQYVPPSVEPVKPESNEYNEHDASIAHLWNNIKLIPLSPELFDTPEEEESTMNLTALFNDAVPLSPDLTVNEPPDLEFDIDRISIDNADGHITISEDLDKNADAKFMAYILIGACCGLALLSIGGVIVIVRFKKTCGSKQIRTRTRLTEQDSIENISRHVENMAQGGDSGHKLGSWFTGRNEHIGSGKLRSNMTLPTVHDLKREKGSKSGSTRDLLSISSESSHTSSPRQKHRSGDTSGRNEDEEPRNSWLHDEYRASMSDLSQAPGQDLAYIPRQYQQSRSGHDSSQPSTSHNDHQRYRDVSVEQEQVERSSRERRYTGQSRSERECSPNRRRSHFVSSMESEELEERLDQDNRYATDSEVEDWTTQYEDESREPSRYLSDSRELDDTVARRIDPVTVTSQELGDQLSRDLKQYQSRREGRSDQELHDVDNPQSSQEVDEDVSRELQRSQSQVSFSRDNVQNEVFLEFDNIFRQHGQYLSGGEAPASTLGRLSRATEDTHFSASRANTPDSIDLPEQHSQDDHLHDKEPPPSPPTTPPRFSPPPAPPRPPKPGHLSQPSTPSPTGNRAKLPSPDQSPPSPPRNQRPVYWTSEEERLI